MILNIDKEFWQAGHRPVGREKFELSSLRKSKNSDSDVADCWF